jgi:predicted porin
MHVKTLPALLGVILVGGISMAVQADITVFGHIDTSIEYFDRDDGSEGDDGVGDDTNFVCTTCSIGFKGSEDLGNGLKAIFKLDFQYDTINRNVGSFTDRDQWLGMAGNFGQLRVGTISTVYKSHGAKIDPIYRTALQLRDRGLQSNMHTGAGEEGQGRADHTARYDTPSWNGLKLGATYTLDSTDTDEDDDNPYGVGLSYENAGILLFADYITNDSGDDDEAYKVGGKWTFNNLALMGQYEFDEGLITSKAPGTDGDGADTWFLGGSFTLGNSMVLATYGRADGGDSLSNYTTWTLAGTYSMSKRTKLYAGANSIDCDDPDTNVCKEVGDNGGEDEQFNFGMKHIF